MGVRYGLLSKPVRVQFLSYVDRIRRALPKPHIKSTLISANNKQKPSVQSPENTIGIDFKFNEDVVAANASHRI